MLHRHRNFGIVKHPGTGATNLTTAHTEEDIYQADPLPESKFARLVPKKEVSTAQDILASKGFISVAWHGKCDADKVSIGTYDVPAGQSGMFGLVFDNTFSK